MLGLRLPGREVRMLVDGRLAGSRLSTHLARSAQTKNPSPAAESLSISSRLDSKARSLARSHSRGRGVRRGRRELVTRRVVVATKELSRGRERGLFSGRLTRRAQGRRSWGMGPVRLGQSPPCRQIKGTTAMASEEERRWHGNRDGSVRPDTSDGQRGTVAAGGGRDDVEEIRSKVRAKSNGKVPGCGWEGANWPEVLGGWPTTPT